MLEGENVFGADDGVDFFVLFNGCLADDFFFLFGAGVVDEDVEHEAVELRFRKGVGAFLFEGVLGGEYEEGLGEFEGRTAGGDVVFLHGFEERGLCFGRGAVDFVGEQEVGEDGAFDEFEDAFLGFLIFFEDVGADDVGGHEVRCELDTLEVQFADFGEGADHECFGESGNADDEAVSAADHGEHELFDDFFLADDYFLHFVEDGGAPLLAGLDGFGAYFSGGGLLCCRLLGWGSCFCGRVKAFGEFVVFIRIAGI